MRPLRPPLRLSHYRGCAVALFGVLGIFAFVASAISQQDDDYQHECLPRGRVLHIVVCSTKATAAKRTGHDLQALAVTANVGLFGPQTAELSLVLDAVCSVNPHLLSRSGRAPPIS